MDEIECGPPPEKGWVLTARPVGEAKDLMLFNADLLADPLNDKPVRAYKLAVLVTCACHAGSENAEIRSYSKRWRKGERPLGRSSYYGIVFDAGGGVRGPSLQTYLKGHREVKFEVL